MAYNPVPTVATGDLWTASNHNTYIRDNFAAGVPEILTAKGSIPVATGYRAAAELITGNAGQVLTPDTAYPTGLKWKNFPTWSEWSNSNWGSVPKNIGTYIVNASDWGVPASGVGAIIIGILGAWTAASSGNFLSARRRGSSADYVIVRSRVADIYNDAFGMIPLVNGQFDLVVAGANATLVLVKIYGYFPG